MGDPVRKPGAGHPGAFNTVPGTAVAAAEVEWVEIVSLHGQEQDAGTVRQLLGGPDVSLLTGIYRLEPGEEHPLHLHPTVNEVYFVISGRARFQLGDEEIVGTPGTTLHMPVGLPHAVTTDDEHVEVLYVFDTNDITRLGTRFLDPAGENEAGG